MCLQNYKVRMNPSGYEEKIKNVIWATYLSPEMSNEPQDRNIHSESTKHMLVPYHTKNYYIIQTYC